MKKLMFIILLLICIQPNAKSQFYYGYDLKSIYDGLIRDPSNLKVEAYQDSDTTMSIIANTSIFTKTYLFNKENICFAYVLAAPLSLKDIIYNDLNELYIRTKEDEWENSDIYVFTRTTDDTLFIFEVWKESK